MINHQLQQRMTKLRLLLLLRPLLIFHVSTSPRQRYEVIEYLDILRTLRPNTDINDLVNNEDRINLENIINCANNYLIHPFNNEISSPEYARAVRTWTDLSTWNNLNNECIQLIINHCADTTNRHMGTRIN